MTDQRTQVPVSPRQFDNFLDFWEAVNKAYVAITGSTPHMYPEELLCAAEDFWGFMEHLHQQIKTRS